MIPPIADSEDPTTQIPWPAARGRHQDEADGVSDSDNEVQATPAANNGVNRKPRTSSPGRKFSTWDLITLSISMGGAQIAWTVELGCVFGAVVRSLTLSSD